MLVKNLVTGSTPGVIHRNGHTPEWKPIWEQLVTGFFAEAQKRLAPCLELTVLTWTNRPTKTLLERCLDHWGISCLTLGKRLPEWRNDMKLFLNVEALDRIETEYVMGLDADDVLLVADLHHIVAGFRAFGCDLLFNAEKNSYPNARFLAEFEESIAESVYPYLNSGAWIGKTEMCRRFFKDCLDQDNGDIVAAIPARSTFWSDQAVIRKTFRQYFPSVRLDYHCRIFQSLYLVSTSEVVVDAEAPPAQQPSSPHLAHSIP